MSLNCLPTSNNVPFFPPGIASHKMSSSFRRPQSVKECKKLSKSRIYKPSTIPSFNNRMSISTPNLKVMVTSIDQTSLIPKHHCDMGVTDHSRFRATPLPRIYSPDSLERNRSLFEQLNQNYKTRSLDRVSVKSYSLDRVSMKSRLKNVTKFLAEKPFYPPSKYPNMHDKNNVNLSRLLETREQYKTPKSRRSLSVINKNKSKQGRPDELSMKTINIGGSVPNLTMIKSKKGKQKIKTISKLPNENLFNNFNTKNETDFTHEIGLYRQYDKLDLQDEFHSYIPKQMSASYYYPKPIPNSLNTDYHDKMVQSLYNESSLAAKIQTGSLERATRNDFQPQNNENKIVITDLDDSPTKSYSPIKPCNSFSQDSLDGSKKNCDNIDNIYSEKDQSETTDSLVEGEKSYNSNSENNSLTTESKTYRFQSATEDDLSSSKIESQNKYLNSLSTISEKDKTYDDHKNSSLVHNNNPNENSIPDLILNEIDFNIINNSKCNDPNEENQFYDMDSENASSKLISGTYKFQPPMDDMMIPLNIENPYQYIDDTNTISKRENIINEKSKHELLDQYNLDRYLLSNSILDVGYENKILVSADSLYINNEFMDEIKLSTLNTNDKILLDNIASKCIVSTNEQLENYDNWKTEKCLCGDTLLIGTSCKKCFMQSQIPHVPNGLNSDLSTAYSSINTQASGLDYDLTDMGVPNNLLNEQGTKIFQLPGIELQLDVTKSVDDSASESESSLSGSDDTSFMRFLPQPGMSWVSSPELQTAHSDIVSRKHRRHLQSENPLKPLCNVCFKPAYFMERISINNIIFHKMCFLCKKCDTHLSFNNCVIYHRKPYCIVHARPKSLKISRSVSASKLSQIKERLDNRSNLQKQSSTEVKQPKRVFYGGIKSAKEKFLQDTSAVPEQTVREPKRFTPPRQGVTSGIIENEPKPRDPNVIASGDYTNSFNEDLNRLSQSSATKEKVARFKELQEKSFDSKNLPNGDDGINQKPEVIGVDTKILRNKFLSGANGGDFETKPRKLNPSEEIQELARKESNTVYENEPEIRNDVVKSDEKYEQDVLISRNKAKEMKNLFSNYNSEDRSKKTEKFQMEIGEGGIYESNPQERNDDVFICKSDKNLNLPNNTVKDGLQKIKELQTLKSQGYQKSKTEPIKLDMDSIHSGIYENIPTESRADSIADQNDLYLSNIPEKKYANDAKLAFLEKQKLEEEGRIKRDKPQMIDIWKDLCVDSGVFENKPTLQKENVTRHEDKQDEFLTVKTEEENIENIENRSSI